MKRGDKIIINRENNDVCWYTPHIYTVVDISENKKFGDCLILDRNLCEGYNNLLHISYAVNLNEQRRKKIKKIEKRE